MQQEKKSLKWLNKKTFGILISILFLFLIFHNINFKEVWLSMKTFNLAYCIPAIITYALSYIIRTFRWKELLSITKNIKFSSVLKAIYIGYMSNTLLPARMGELYRAHFMGSEQNIKRSSVLASIVAERIFDGLTLFFLLTILLLFFHNTTWLIEICITTGCIFLGGFVVIVFVSKSKNIDLNFITNSLKILPDFIRAKLQIIISSFIEGLGVIESFKKLFYIVLTSIGAWFLEWCTMFIIVSGFTNLHQVNPISVAFLVVLVAFSTMIPSGPAFVGPYQYAFILALEMSSIGKDTAVAVAITTQAVMMLPVVTVGMILLWISHLSLNDLEKNIEPETT